MKHFWDEHSTVVVEERVQRFLQSFMQQPAAGLLVLAQPAHEERLLLCLEAAGLCEAFSCYEALYNIELALPTFIVLEAPLQQEFCDLIEHHRCLSGACSKLLFVVSSHALHVIESELPLREKVGVVQKI